MAEVDVKQSRGKQKHSKKKKTPHRRSYRYDTDGRHCFSVVDVLHVDNDDEQAAGDGNQFTSR